MGLTTTTYKNSLRPLLRLASPHLTHRLSEVAMGKIPWNLLKRFNGLPDPRLSVEVAGLQLPSPVGSAAGLDKHCNFIHNLLNLGYGYAVGGTITLEPYTGNPRPSLAYRRTENALVNSMGFPNDGLKQTLPRLAKNQQLTGRQWLSISGDTIDEFVALYKATQEHAHAIEVNISSPNRQTLKGFHSPQAITELLDQLTPLKSVPTFVKLPREPKSGEERVGAVMELAEAALNAGVDGIVLANSLPVKDSRLAIGAGGLTGKPLLPTTLQLVSEAYSVFGKDAVIVASGGISSGIDVWRLLEVGASSTQIYTAMVYQGFWIAADINGSLIKLMERHGVKNLADIRGTAQSG